MPPAFSAQLDLKLIKLVKDNPVIYNPRHPKYSDCDTRELTWQKIGDEMCRPTAEFAGIQCQIQFGDYHEEKHKPGFIENFAEYLPEQYRSSWGIEKKILKEYSKHVGLNELDAKHLYTKTARELPTYGVTFFLVKEKQKGKKKLVPRLLGINADAILRLDETTKEIIQQWPLTHVKTYHAGKGETFTLNFGDYNDKEYSVKTRDAFRIRDILEGYIDLIRKRMLANYNSSLNEQGYVSQDNVSSGQACMVQHITNTPMKIVETSFVGPTKLVQHEPGQKASEGSQMVTAYQIVTSELANKLGQGVKGEVPMRSDMSKPFTRRLNRLNSSAVKIATLLTEPSQANLEQVKNIVDEMNADMPSVRDGVKETVANQSSDDEKKKLLDQLQELEELLKALTDSTNPGSENIAEADDAAKKIADVTTQMYFALDPGTRRGSRYLQRSQSSFIADEKMEKSLRRPSFIAATAAANHAIDNAEELIGQEYQGSPLNPKQVEQLEKSALDKIGKLNAAIAHYLLAHSDPQNIDYGAAVTSLNTIHELMPGLAEDGQALSSVKDGKDRKELVGDIKELCSAAKHICSLSGVEDEEKLQEATDKYADVAGKLLFIFGRGSKQRADKENEVMALAKDVGAKTSQLLISAQGLTEMASEEPAAADVDAAGAHTAAAAKVLLTQAELNAPTIHEPHCQSAMTAASEALSSSAQHLAAAWRPLVDAPHRHEIGEKLHNRTMDLAKALDRLRESYANLGDLEDGSKSPKVGDEAQRLKFIKSLSKVEGSMQAVEDNLNKPLTSAVSDKEASAAQVQLTQRLGQLNAAMAALLAATADRENPDYATAEEAVSIINELMPQVVKDCKTATANQDEASRAVLLDNIRALCDVTKTVCASSYGAPSEGLNDAVGKFTEASGKLTYKFRKRANPERESQIVEQSAAACSQASVLLSGVQQLADAVGGKKREELDERGAKLADAAQSLLTTAQLTAPSISEPRCQSTLLAAIDKVSSSAKQLEDSYTPLKNDPKHEMHVLVLKGPLKQLKAQLDMLRADCQVPDEELQSTEECQLTEVGGIQDPLQKQQKLQFIKTLNGAKEKLADAHKELSKPTMSAKGCDVDAVQDRLSQRLGHLNAAVAALLAATTDREKPDYAAAEKATTTIAELMPHVVRDTKTVSASKDDASRAAMLSQVKELCDATEGICASSYGANSQDLNDAVSKFADASGNLMYVVNPRSKAKQEEQVVDLSSAACGQASQLLSGVQQLAEGVGGARGEALDVRGGRVADAAQGLLQAAQITAASISSPQCRDALLSSVDKLSAANQQLAGSLTPLQDDTKHKKQVQALQQAQQRLEAQLNELRKVCDVNEVDNSEHPAQEKQRQQLIKTMQAAKIKLGDAHKELNKPTKPAKGADVDKVQDRLTEKMGQLNGAIAALLAATADRKNTDYAAAEKAASTIAELMPHVIQDTKTVSASKDDASRAAMLSQVKELCDATEGICASSYGANSQDLDDAVSKFADASGKLMYVFNPRSNAKHAKQEEQIVDLSSAACGQASQLLSGVQQLAEGVGGARGEALDVRGGRVADAAQGLLQAAQITAASISSPQCRDALLSSVDKLSAANQQLAGSLTPLQDDTKHKKQVQALQQAQQRLEAQLNELRKVCDANEIDKTKKPAQEHQKIQLIKTLQTAKETLGDAQKELNKPAMPAKGSDVDKVQDRLSQRLGHLNGAIAALLAATADRANPDYATAEQAASNIAELMPQLIQDTKTVSASKDDASRAAMLSQVKELCDATEGICASSYGANPQDLNDAVSKFADASGKLVYVVGPRPNLQREKQIMDLSREACGQTSQLVSGVKQLAEGVGGARGEALDARGGRVADAAQGLLRASRITAPSISSPHSRDALLSSVVDLSTANKQLAASLTPLLDDPKHMKQVEGLKRTQSAIDTQLDWMRKACKPHVTDVDCPQDMAREQQKLRFNKTLQGTKSIMADAQKELDTPSRPTKASHIDRVQDRLVHGLERLNASIAKLIAATADRENPDYEAAEKAAADIADLMPQVVQDTKTVSAGKDEARRAAMLSHIKKLCDASEILCANTDGTNPRGLKDAVAKFADASGKLLNGASPGETNKPREEQVMDVSREAHGQASQLLAGVRALAGAAGGARGEMLLARGERVEGAAEGLLYTSQILAPSISSSSCGDALLMSVDNLSTANKQLAASLAQLQNDPKHKKQADALHQALQRLEAQINKLRTAFAESESEPSGELLEQQKLHFIRTVQANTKWSDAHKELAKPTALAKGADVEKVQNRLAQDLGQLNAAIASLLAATADRENPSYPDAEQSFKTITDLLPQLVKDTKTVSASKDDASRAAMLSQVKKLCDATEGICASSYGASSQDLNDAVAKFADASGKLTYVVSPRVNPQREEQIINLSAAACGETSALLSGVQQLAEGVGGGRGEVLDFHGGKVADAAQGLLQTAQLTSSSASYPECQKALLSSVDKLSDTSQGLAAALGTVKDSQHGPQARKLQLVLEALEAQLDKLRKACLLPDNAAPSSKKKPPPPARAPPGGQPHAAGTVAHASSNRGPSVDSTQDFLNRMRSDETLAQAPPHHPASAPPSTVTSSPHTASSKPKPLPPTRNPEEEKRLQQQFLTLVDDAEKNIKQHESILMKLCRSETGTGPALSQSDMMKKQEALQHNLALAGVEVANLVAANYADKIDYTTASKATKALPQLMTSIIEDGKQMSDNVNDMARKAFLYDMLQLCEAGTKICDAAKSDRQKLNEAAVQFGDTSTKLLYVVSDDVDAALEKEIITRAKAIGDSASRLALDAAGIATAASDTASGSVQEICDAGTACVDAAGKVVYTAKLTAPSIHETPCQNALVASTENLSAKLKAFSDSWKPLASVPQQARTVKELTKEADNLERILEGLRSDVKGGNLGKRREMEHLAIEDTPLRQLSVKILDDAKVSAEFSDLPASQKIEYAAYADRLKEALRDLDVSYARCKKTPHDTNKRRDLETAIQNLQMTLLQTRPNRGDKGMSKIVDVTDFIKEVSAEAKNMCAAASGVKVPTAQDKRTLEEIKDKCNAIETKANKLMNVDNRTDMDSTFDDILEVDHFGQECDAIIKQINTDLKGMEDVKAKRVLLSNMMPLRESCNMLRFATKSGISTEASASFDSSLDALDDIEARVITSIVQDANPDGVPLHSKPPRGGNSTATINLCREVASSATGVAPHTVTAYIADAALRTDTDNPEHKNKLLKHLYKLVHLLKTLTVTSSKRSATWQPVDGPEVSTVTEQILQEIYNPESKFDVKAGEKKNTIIDERDIAKLLIPSAPKILGDKKQQEEKLVQLSAKLSSMSGSLALGVTSPTSLARSAHATADAALELDAVARGCITQDHMHKKRVDDAAKEMSFATYTVLKTAESASQEPGNPNTKRRLAAACEMLNRYINKLVSASSSAPALQQHCGALSRDMTLQLAALQPAPTSAVPFEDSCNLLDEQKENIYKLKNDQPLPRKEFMKNLDDIGTAVRKSTECAAHCAYYIAISDLHKDTAKTGLVDVPQIQNSIEKIQDSCMAIIGSSNICQATDEKAELHRRVQDLSGALDKAQVMVADGEVKRTLVRAKSCVSEAADGLEVHLKDSGDMSKVTPKAVNLLEAVNRAHILIDQCPLVPKVGDMTADTKAKCDEVVNHSKSLLTNTLTLLKNVNSSPEEPETMTWVSFGTSRKKLLEAYDALVKSVKKNGHRAGILEKAPEEEKEEVRKSFIETQVDLANKWLKSPASKTEAKAVGQQAVRNVVDIARQMSEDLKGSEREELRNVITDTEQLLVDCTKKYDHEKNSLLMDRVKELKKSIQRGVVTRVVEDFIEAEAPLTDLEILADSEQDETKRKFILERKIASLLAQLGRVTKTARFVAGASAHQQIGVELTQCSEQTELLAPMLVQAAQQRIDHPDDKVVVEKYKSLLAKYAESISKVRDLCDRAVDPMDFVQTAGDTMQRMREDMQHSNDPQKCAYTSSAITKLANRVINVSMSSNTVQSDPELQKALVAAKQRLHAVTPAPNTRASRLPDWRESTAEILRTTGDVESALGGENIFKKQPTTANQSIFSAARDMHECVREWSARDNEIVGVARRMAVLMARLSEFMETDRKEALISTSKSIVLESHEVAELAKKLAHECTDVRIKTNLLQTCERIPTISGQLKMLTTVKGSSLGHQGSDEDKEAMDMLVGNAQSLMLSIQEVVKAAASASVKIMSQRGPRLRWVRKNFY